MDEKAEDNRTISLEDVTTRDSTDEVENIAPSSSNPPLAGKDKAAQYLNQTGRRIKVTPEDNARILRKIDLTILPILLVVYCLQSLDKTSLSYASVFGLIDDAHLHGQQYSWLGSIVYLAQLVMQPLVAYFLVKLPTGKFTATMVLVSYSHFIEMCLEFVNATMPHIVLLRDFFMSASGGKWTAKSLLIHPHLNDTR